MKITWLGQAGLMFETENKIILVDPYLSDNVKNFEPKNYRRVPVDEKFLKINPDVIIITHNHLDHLDKETLKYYLTENAGCLVLAPNGSWQELRKFGGNSNYVLFNNGTTWTENDITFTAVKAEHSDPYAIGVIINAEGKNYYVTGDTLYNEQVFESLPDIEIEAIFLPVNGVGNNMNMTDAARFAKRVNAKYTVPFHICMFDTSSADSFECENKVSVQIYVNINLS
ncbi:MAG: MBL fold metallo-hydrolase [Clostridia bacterium]|nr:MBL fold metallo-hydrolase [Clostridia bacterium]